MIKVNSLKMQTRPSIRNAVFIVMVMVSSASVGETVNLSAKFAPSPTQPGKNEFVNTTPVSGYCSLFPAECRNNGTFSVQLSLGAKSVSPIEANQDDPRKGVMIRVPGAWRKIQVTNSQGTPYDLEFRISGIGATKNFNPRVATITGSKDAISGHNSLWDGAGWVYAAKNCGASYSGVGWYSDYWYTFFWKKDATDAVCFKKALFRIPEFSFSSINISYELRTPNPLDMRSGDYLGDLRLTVGNGGDIDFGDQLEPTDSNLDIRFDLRVYHFLSIVFPPNAQILSLYPVGGWQQWLHSGRRPEKLVANQSFQIWSSGQFKMLLACQYSVADQCGIQNKAGHLVPVETRVTLPNRIMNEDGKPANRHLLSVSNPTVFHNSQFVENGRAALDFEVNRESVAQMIKYAGSRYSGNVTIVWDSEL
ncbi:hypothetical protein [Pseudomonas lurida]|uniref:hypothetical protein n=1 Tax=Pseudomonas lurida TaxID=244566 RepID=UPI002735D965|nr:hypothetical protein [Pseudomonas lurida]WLG29634.1 hypothetical protein PSH68_05495 [Pseudomonas lurida]